MTPTGLVAAFGLEPTEDAARRAAHAALAISPRRPAPAGPRRGPSTGHRDWPARIAVPDRAAGDSHGDRRAGLASAVGHPGRVAGEDRARPDDRDCRSSSLPGALLRAGAGRDGTTRDHPSPHRPGTAGAYETGMRPLEAHGHLGLGKLYRRVDQRGLARQHLSAATTMYHEMTCGSGWTRRRRRWPRWAEKRTAVKLRQTEPEWTLYPNPKFPLPREAQSSRAGRDRTSLGENLAGRISRWPLSPGRAP